MWVAGYLGTFVVVGVLGLGLGVHVDFLVCGVLAVAGFVWGCVIWFWWVFGFRCGFVRFVLCCWFWSVCVGCGFGAVSSGCLTCGVGLGFLAPGLVLGCASFCCAAWVFVLRVSCAW